jgi:two-component system NtrC family sensor kinase
MTKLLIVDDDRDLLRSLRRQLGVRWSVTTAESVDHALAELEAQTFDAILCDLEMPERNGIDLYLALERSRPELIDRVIFVTGHVDAPLDRLVRGTDNPRLTKPVDVTLLAGLIGADRPTTPPPPAR